MAKEIAGFYRPQGTTRSDRNVEARVPAGVACHDDKHEVPHLREPTQHLQLQEPGTAHAAARSLELPKEAKWSKTPGSEEAPSWDSYSRNEERTQSQEDINVQAVVSDSKQSVKPIFAQPVHEDRRLRGLKGQVGHHSQNIGTEGHEKPGSDDGRKPLLEVGQKVVGDVSSTLAFPHKARLQRSSDIENELIEGSPDTAFQEKEIRRLRRQRSELLETGIYGVSDVLIKGIDSQIRKLETG